MAFIDDLVFRFLGDTTGLDDSIDEVSGTLEDIVLPDLELNFDWEHLLSTAREVMQDVEGIWMMGAEHMGEALAALGLPPELVESVNEASAGFGEMMEQLEQVRTLVIGAGEAFGLSAGVMEVALLAVEAATMGVIAGFVGFVALKVGEAISPWAQDLRELEEQIRRNIEAQEELNASMRNAESSRIKNVGKDELGQNLESDKMLEEFNRNIEQSGANQVRLAKQLKEEKEKLADIEPWYRYDVSEAEGQGTIAKIQEIEAALEQAKLTSKQLAEEKERLFVETNEGTFLKADMINATNMLKSMKEQTQAVGETARETALRHINDMAVTEELKKQLRIELDKKIQAEELAKKEAERLDKLKEFTEESKKLAGENQDMGMSDIQKKLNAVDRRDDLDAGQKEVLKDWIEANHVKQEGIDLDEARRKAEEARAEQARNMYESEVERLELKKIELELGKEAAEAEKQRRAGMGEEDIEHLAHLKEANKLLEDKKKLEEASKKVAENIAKQLMQEEANNDRRNSSITNRFSSMQGTADLRGLTAEQMGITDNNTSPEALVDRQLKKMDEQKAVAERVLEAIKKLTPAEMKTLTNLDL